MVEELTADGLRGELKKSQTKCAELEAEILRKDETIRKLTVVTVRMLFNSKYC